MKTPHTPYKMKPLCAALLGAALALPLAATAADKAMDKSANPIVKNDPAAYSDRAQMKSWGDEKKELENGLKQGQDRAYYRKALGDMGFAVTSVNKDTPDGLEYEVVKGGHSYEVALDFDKTGKAKKVEVDTNVWRADATKAALRGEKVAMADKYLPTNAAYRDRTHMKAWSGEKDQLEKALGTGHDKTYYKTQLEKMGYQITSVNDNDKDHAEYEVVKGNNTFEVQVDFDNGKSKEVDVTTNMWQSDATEKALAAHKR